MNKIEGVLNSIDEEQLDILAVTESYIREDHPTAIKNDPAPPGYTITYGHRTLGVKAKGGGIAVIARESLRARPFKLNGKFSSFELSTVYLTVQSGCLNLFTIYRSLHSSGFFEDF